VRTTQRTGGYTPDSGFQSSCPLAAGGKHLSSDLEVVGIRHGDRREPTSGPSPRRHSLPPSLLSLLEQIP
jgi:hypothetical protein